MVFKTSGAAPIKFENITSTSVLLYVVSLSDLFVKDESTSVVLYVVILSDLFVKDVSI